MLPEFDSLAKARQVLFYRFLQSSLGRRVPASLDGSHATRLVEHDEMRQRPYSKCPTQFLSIVVDIVGRTRRIERLAPILFGVVDTYRDGHQLRTILLLHLHHCRRTLPAR